MSRPFITAPLQRRFFLHPTLISLLPFFRMKARSTLVIYLIVLSFYLEIDLIPSELSVITLFLESQLI